jgi:hypothetical protein
MGGLGSGRSSGGPTVDDCLTLDLSKLFRNGAFEAGALSNRYAPLARWLP